MKRLTTSLIATVLLTACSGGLSGIAKKTAVCCMPTLQCDNGKESVCISSSEAEEETDDDSAPVLLTGFLIR